MPHTLFHLDAPDDGVMNLLTGKISLSGNQHKADYGLEYCKVMLAAIP